MGGILGTTNEAPSSSATTQDNGGRLLQRCSEQEGAVCEGSFELTIVRPGLPTEDCIFRIREFRRLKYGMVPDSFAGL